MVSLTTQKGISKLFDLSNWSVLLLIVHARTEQPEGSYCDSVTFLCRGQYEFVQKGSADAPCNAIPNSSAYDRRVMVWTD